MRRRPQPGLLEQLAAQPVLGVLTLVEEPARRVPEPLVGLDGTPGEEDATGCVLDERADARRGVGVVRRPAGSAERVRALVVQGARTAGARAPAMEDRHRPATV